MRHNQNLGTCRLVEDSANEVRRFALLRVGLERALLVLNLFVTPATAGKERALDPKLNQPLLLNSRMGKCHPPKCQTHYSLVKGCKNI